jgi:predicted MPP superfamily phosphohydrolase
MPKITILHISDFHWSEAKRADMAIVVEALCRDLQELRGEDIRPDIIVFTGDLVEAGEEKASFDLADDALFAKVLAATGLQSDRLFVAPGNHDIARSVVRNNELLETGTSSMLTSVDATNKFIDDLPAGNPVNRLAIARLNHFDAYASSTNYVTPITNTPLVRTYTIDVSGYKIGLACFNTAWRASGEKDDVDRHKLLLGEHNVDFAVRDLEAADIRIAAFHHPLDWLASFDETAVASRMYGSFDLLMFGHTHQSFPEARITPVGSSVFSQAGCLYQRRGYFNGYQVICLDPDVEQLEFAIRTYFDSPRRSFAPAVNIAPNGRLRLPFKLHSASGERHPRVERVLRTARSQIRATASEHINLTEKEADKSVEVKETFVCPPLTIRRPWTSDARCREC